MKHSPSAVPKSAQPGSEQLATSPNHADIPALDIPSEHASLLPSLVPVTDDLPRLVELLHSLETTPWDDLPSSVRSSLTGLAGLRLLATAMTVHLTDCGGTSPTDTYELMADFAPDLFDEFSDEFIIALCKQVQEAEIPEESTLGQRMFDAFNAQYFDGLLPSYKIRVVVDLWYWETERLGCPEVSPPAYSASGFIHFEKKEILIRFLAFSSSGRVTMGGTLLHEMAHAAAGGDHGERWQSETRRLKQLGAPVDDSEVEKYGLLGEGR